MQETKKLPKGKEDTNEALEEHRFIASCLKMGLSIDNLKQFEYKDIAKIMLCFVDREENKSRKATQSDWDRLAGRR